MKKQPTQQPINLENYYSLEFSPKRPPVAPCNHISKLTKLSLEDWKTFYNTISFGEIQGNRIITARTYPELLPFVKNSSVLLSTYFNNRNYKFIVDDFSIQNIVTEKGPKYKANEESVLLYEHEGFLEFVKEFTIFLTHKFGEKHLAEAIEYRKTILKSTEQTLKYLKEHKQEIIESYKSKKFKFDGEDVASYVDRCEAIQEHYVEANKELLAFMEQIKSNLTEFFVKAKKKYVSPFSSSNGNFDVIEQI